MIQRLLEFANDISNKFIPDIAFSVYENTLLTRYNDNYIITKINYTNISNFKNRRKKYQGDGSVSLNHASIFIFIYLSQQNQH